MSLLAIVGRPNVGKSTLFNRLIGEKKAITEDTPGVTRDRIYGDSEWNGYKFGVIDTGGFIPGSENVMEKSIREQAQFAIDEADVILFVCDGKDGITKFDEDIAQVLRKTSKPVVLVINKCDTHNTDPIVYEFYKLGFGEPFPISSTNGRNTGDFLDIIVDNMPKTPYDLHEGKLKIAFVGRPNAGKSSLTNALLGEKRSIVDDVPGTTRDSIDSVLKFHGEEIIMIDTAGLRKRSTVKESIEILSNIRTQKAIERCDVAVVLLDSERGLEDQDKKIINLIDKAGKGLIIAFNKWDLVEKDHKTSEAMTEKFYNDMKTFDYAPVMFVSAVTKQRIIKIIEKAIEINKVRNTRIKTHLLNDAILPDLERTTPPAVRGQDLRINYMTQVSIAPPQFAVFCNFPQLMPDSYKRFIERTIRKHFPMEGSPMSITMKRKNVKWTERNSSENSRKGKKNNYN